jgi:hypothetical protein
VDVFSALAANLLGGGGEADRRVAAAVPLRVEGPGSSPLNVALLLTVSIHSLGLAGPGGDGEAEASFTLDLALSPGAFAAALGSWVAEGGQSLAAAVALGAQALPREVVQLALLARSSLPQEATAAPGQEVRIVAIPHENDPDEGAPAATSDTTLAAETVADPEAEPPPASRLGRTELRWSLSVGLGLLLGVLGGGWWRRARATVRPALRSRITPSDRV